jgi:hypothetical protein
MLKQSLVYLATVVGLSLATHGAMIDLDDASFETPIGDPWVTSDEIPAGYGWTDLQLYCIIRTSGAGNTHFHSVPDGEQALNGAGTQMTDVMVEPLTEYDLSFYVGATLNKNYDPGTVLAELLDGSVTLASGEFDAPDTRGDWTQHHLVFATGTAVAGNNLGIRFSNVDGTNFYDYIQLSSVVIPEPASLALLGLTTVAALATRRRR